MLFDFIILLSDGLEIGLAATCFGCGQIKAGMYLTTFAAVVTVLYLFVR